MRRKSHSAAERYARLSRERRRRHSAPAPVPETPEAPGAVPIQRAARVAVGLGGVPRSHDFSLEYTYLASDLRRIAMVAGGLLVAMILGARFFQ